MYQCLILKTQHTSWIDGRVISIHAEAVKQDLLSAGETLHADHLPNLMMPVFNDYITSFDSGNVEGNVKHLAQLRVLLNGV